MPEYIFTVLLHLPPQFSKPCNTWDSSSTCLQHSLALYWPNTIDQLGWLRRPSVWKHRNVGFVVNSLEMPYVTQNFAFFRSEVIVGEEGAAPIFSSVTWEGFSVPRAPLGISDFSPPLWGFSVIPQIFMASFNPNSVAAWKMPGELYHCALISGVTVQY